MHKQKICITTPEFPPHQWGGLARTVERVACHARDIGFDVHVACFSIDPQNPILLDENRETLQQNGIIVHFLTVAKEQMTDIVLEIWDCPHTLTLQMMYQSLELLHQTEKFDLFHSFFLYPVGYITGILAKKYRAPSLTTIVGNDINKYIFSPEKVEVCRSGLENADRVVALSRDLMEMADALSPIRQKSKIIYNSVEIPKENWVPKSDQESLRIGCAGIFKYAKGLPYLFKAIALIRREGLILELRGELRKSERPIYQQMLAKTDTGDLVVFREPLPHDKIPDWLRTLDMFVLPSISEGCPNILMEALACGVPCIATRTGANEELIENYVSGILVPWGNSAALAEALTELANNSDLRQSQGSAGRLRMRQFSPERERLEWESIYREIMRL
ncbi:MAG: glycosyltransferase [Desulfomonilaceae bacterium]